MSPAQFAETWREVQQLLRTQLGHDLVDLEKMPEIIGEQANPFVALGVTPHVNDAYLTTLGGDWETYYAEAIGVDAQDRPQEAQAPGRSWRDSIHHRGQS